MPATLLMIAGMSLSLFTILDMQNRARRLNTAQNAIVGTEVARSKIMAAIMNTENWQATRLRNVSQTVGTLPPTQPSGSQTPSSFQPSSLIAPPTVISENAITFYNADGSVFYNPGAPNRLENGPVHAFGVDGEKFQLSPRSESMGPIPSVYFRVVVNIQERDPDPTCTNCADRVVGHIEVIQPTANEPTPVLPVFTGTQAFDFTRTKTNRSLEIACSLLGGTYTAANGCSYRLGFEGGCPTGQSITGFNGNQFTCRQAISLQNSGCSTGQYAKGIYQGRFICSDLPNAHGDDENPVFSCPNCGT